MNGRNNAAMKCVLLSHDSELSVYSVPDIVADNLRGYCCEFADKWLWTSPHAKEYHTETGVLYNEHDFIKYLNAWILPNEQSLFVETLNDVWGTSDIPEKYKGCEWFNF
ncbi:MAG: hypothetical protein LBI44_05150 [Oscillospiraceae bacterium]|jgi:hypothetical protein|nr:hypothetical protein [Oscillospiraceae bacterium]